MKIKDNGITSRDGKLIVEVLLDDGITNTTIEIDPGPNNDKSDVNIKKEIKDIINSRQTKNDNLKGIKTRLEGNII